MSTDRNIIRLLKTIVATLVVVIVGWLVAPTLTNWQTRQLADRLVERIANADDADVKVPLHQLASLGELSVEPLVVAAASNRASVATVSRQILEQKVALLAAQTRGPITTGEHQEFANSTTTLAQALADHVHRFGPLGKLWAEQLAFAMIELTDRLPAAHTQQLLESCSNVLATVPPRGPRLRTIATSNVPISRPPRMAQAAPAPQLEPLTKASESSLEVLARIQSGSPQHLTRVHTSEPLSANNAFKSPNSALTWSATNRGTTPVPTAQPSSQARVLSVGKPAQPTNNQVIDIPTPQEMANQAAALRLLSTDKLFQRMSGAKFYEAGIIRSVLAERGYDDAELVLRQQLTSPNANDRLRIIDDVSDLPAATARRLLRWLLGDENAEVRLRALTALATTNAPDLAELARNLSVSDQDPRVAELASRLLQQTR